MGQTVEYKGEKYYLEEMEVLAIKVALPKNMRNGKFSEKGLMKIEPRHKNLFLTRGKSNGKVAMGRLGWMALEDFENKNFAEYGLSEVASKLDSVLKSRSLESENSTLQNDNIAKDAEIEKLKAELEKLKVPTIDPVKPEAKEKKEVKQPKAKE